MSNNQLATNNVDYGFEDQVDCITNRIILKLYKQYQSDNFLAIQKLVKDYLLNK